MYFCDEEHFRTMENDLLKVEELIHFIREATNMNLYDSSSIGKGNRTFALKYINEYRNNGMLDSLHYVLQNRRHSIRKYMDTKTFNNDKAKCKYLFIMINDGVIEENDKRLESAKRQEKLKQVEMVETTSSSTTRKRRGINEFL